MLEELFFILGFVNNLFLIFIFLIRKDKMVLLKRIGWVYLLLAIPAVYGIFLVAQEQKAEKGNGVKYLSLTEVKLFVKNKDLTPRTRIDFTKIGKLFKMDYSAVSQVAKRFE